MRHDFSPVGHTCPLIDSVIAFLNGIDTDEVSAQSIKEQIDRLEEIRDANSTLREWGNEYFLKYDELEKDYDLKNREVQDLERQLKDFESLV